MDDLRIIVSCTITPEKTEEFKKTAKQLLTIVREKDSGTLRYDWFLTADGTNVKVQEDYKSSDAIISHMHNMGEHLEHIISLCSSVSIDILGNPSSQVRDAIAPFNPTIYSDVFQKL